MKKKLILILLFTIYTSVSHSKPLCEKLFQNQTPLQKVGGLFLKDPISNPLPTKLLGFATLTLNKNFRFTPFKALDDNLLKKPTHFVTEKIGGKKKELGALIKIPLIILLSVTAWKNFDEHIFLPEVEARMTEQIANHIEKNSPYYDKLIETDYRFKDIKQSKSSIADSRLQAFGLKRAYEDYFRTYMGAPLPKDLTLQDNIEMFGSNPLFSHLNFFFENGIKQYEGTYVPSQHQGPLSDEQKKKLFDLTHLLYAKYLVIDLMFENDTDSANLIERNLLARDVFENEHSQKLISLHKENKISKEELIYYMQEDAHHVYYMTLFETLHIVNLKSEKNLYTKDPLTLSDLRNSRLSNLQ